MAVKRKRKEIKPQAGPQTAFLSSPADIVFYGGAAGSGKTWGLLMEPLRHVTTVKDFKCVIFRRTAPQVRNEGGLWDESLKIYPWARGVPRETILEWQFPWPDGDGRGATVRMASLPYEQSRFDWQGSQIDLIEFDELTHFSEETFWYLLSRSRSTSGVAPYVRGTTNPEAGSWVAEMIAWWIDQETGYPIAERSGVVRYFLRLEGKLIWRDTFEELVPLIPPKMLEDADAEDLIKSFTFIAANIHDNRELLRVNPEYLGNLYALPLVERERLLQGNWTIMPSAGKVFNRGWFKQKIATIPKIGTNLSRIKWIRFWDKAATDGAGDWTVGVLMGFDPFASLYGTTKSVYYVRDVVRGQWSSAERDEQILHTTRADYRTIVLGEGAGYNCVWEEEGGSAGIDATQAMFKLLRGFPCYGRRVTGAKMVRAQPFAGASQRGEVILIGADGQLEADWHRPYIDVLHDFPDGEHDDDVDASSGAFNELNLDNTVDPNPDNWNTVKG